MAGSSKEVKRRIKSAKNIQQITKAMETVAATKMRRAQDKAVAARPYAEKAYALLQSLDELLDVSKHPLLKKKDTGKQLVIFISTDKGLVGGLNTNLNRKLKDFVNDQKSKSRTTDIIAVGKKAIAFSRKLDANVIDEHLGLGDNFSTNDLEMITERAMKEYLNGPYDKIIMAYTNFISTLSQKPYIRGILPLSEQKIEDLGDLTDKKAEDIEKERKQAEVVEYKFEPTTRQVLDELIPRLVESLIYHNMLEANASEHSARMIAMKSASDNASDLIDKLTLSYNRLRQEGITKELAEISAATSQES